MCAVCDAKSSSSLVCEPGDFLGLAGDLDDAVQPKTARLKSKRGKVKAPRRANNHMEVREPEESDNEDTIHQVGNKRSTRGLFAFFCNAFSWILQGEWKREKSNLDPQRNGDGINRLQLRSRLQPNNLLQR